MFYGDDTWHDNYRSDPTERVLEVGEYQMVNAPCSDFDYDEEATARYYRKKHKEEREALKESHDEYLRRVNDI